MTNNKGTISGSVKDLTESTVKGRVTDKTESKKEDKKEK